MQIQPVTGKPVSMQHLPKGIRVKDVPAIYRINGYVLVRQRGELLAVRIH